MREYWRLLGRVVHHWRASGGVRGIVEIWVALGLLHLFGLWWATAVVAGATVLILVALLVIPAVLQFVLRGRRGE
jgi:hypothetical protein